MPQVINTVTKASPTDNYAVVYDTDLKGSYRIVSDITERDAIVSNQRKQGMLVYAISTLHYYELQSDLLTWTDLGLTLGGGYLPPIVRYVYLVQDASDAVRMGGASNNTYTTFQAAYDAANTLQLALGGANIVVLQVMNTTSATVGNLTLASAFNRNIYLNGINTVVSNVGTITSPALNFGIALGAIRITNLKIGNISTSSALDTGSAGTVAITGYNFDLGNIDTTLSNALNTTGLGGNVSLLVFNGHNGNSVNVGTITTSASSVTATAGTVNINSNNATIGNIVTANNNLGGLVSLAGLGSRIENVTVLSLSVSTQASFVNYLIGSLNLSIGSANLSLTNVICKTISLITTGKMIITDSITSSITSALNIECEMKNSSIPSITNLGNNSKIVQCSIGSLSSSAPTLVAIDQIGTGIKIYNSTIIGTTAIQNATPETVTGTYSVFDGIVDPNVTII